MRSSSACVILLLTLLSWSASTGQPPAPTAPGPRTTADRSRDRVENDLSRRMSDMRSLEQRLKIATRQAPAPPPEPKLSAEDRDRVLRLRRVAAPDIERYSAFLKNQRTGIFKLFPNLGCISKNVVRITRECSRFVPVSSAFTFRTNAYTDETFHDIFFKDERITSNSFFTQGIFTPLGDEAVEKVDLSHRGLKYIVAFQPDTDPDAAAKHAADFGSGVESGGFRYTDTITPQENVTYAMRLIAYRLDNSLKPLSEETTLNEMMFHSLAYDKRVDVIVVFRVLGRDANDGLTIVWRELSRDEGAKIKFGKKQPLRDFRPVKR